MRKFLAALAATLVLSAGSAQAAPLTWTLNNVVFNDGGTAVGTFAYDATLNAYSNFNITTTAGGAFGGATYVSYLQSPLSPLVLPFVTAAGVGPDLNAGDTYLTFVFGVSLTGAGGTVSLSGATEGFCVTNPPPGLFCSGPGQINQPMRTLASGSVSAPTPPVVPVPAPAWLFGSALGLLGWLRRQALPAPR